MADGAFRLEGDDLTDLGSKTAQIERLAAAMYETWAEAGQGLTITSAKTWNEADDREQEFGRRYATMVWERLHG